METAIRKGRKRQVVFNIKPGVLNPEWKGYWVRVANDEEIKFITLKEAAVFTGLNYNTIRNWCYKSQHGWYFLPVKPIQFLTC